MPPKRSQTKNTGSKASSKASTSQPPSKKAKGLTPKIVEKKTVAPEHAAERHNTDSDSIAEESGDDIGHVSDIPKHSFGYSEDSDKDFPGETALEKRVRLAKKGKVRAAKAAQKTTPQTLNSKSFFIITTNFS